MSETNHLVVAWNSARTMMLYGSYAVRGGVITVSSEQRAKSAQVGASAPLALAKIMLREMADDADIKCSESISA